MTIGLDPPALSSSLPRSQPDAAHAARTAKTRAKEFPWPTKSPPCSSVTPLVCVVLLTFDAAGSKVPARDARQKLPARRRARCEQLLRTVPARVSVEPCEKF